MNKETKFILILLIIIVILAGIFAWKVLNPSEEKKVVDTVNTGDKIIENELDIKDTEENVDISFDDILTIWFLESYLEENEVILKVVRTVFLICLAITGIIIFIKLKTNIERFKINKKTIISLIVITSIFGIYTCRYMFIGNAVEYAIENKSWYTEKDTVRRVKNEDGKRYIYLKEHGKYQTTWSTYIERRRS